jgi:hypothetical protein
MEQLTCRGARQHRVVIRPRIKRHSGLFSALAHALREGPQAAHVVGQRHLEEWIDISKRELGNRSATLSKDKDGACAT